MLSSDGQAWIDALESVPSWLTRHYNAGVVCFNKNSHVGWQALRCKHAELFERAGFRELSYHVIGAIISMWRTLPNIKPRLEVPLKIGHRGFAGDGAAEATNAIPGIVRHSTPTLHYSSCHGFTGTDRSQVEVQALEELWTASTKPRPTCFRMNTPQARAICILAKLPRYCRRTWTPAGPGLVGMQPTPGGGVLIYTDGFAQSPRRCVGFLRKSACEDSE